MGQNTSPLSINIESLNMNGEYRQIKKLLEVKTFIYIVYLLYYNRLYFEFQCETIHRLNREILKFTLERDVTNSLTPGKRKKNKSHYTRRTIITLSTQV